MNLMEHAFRRSLAMVITLLLLVVSAPARIMANLPG